MAAYFIMRVDVHDSEVYDEHIKPAVEAVKERGGEILARGGRCEQIIGEGRSRNVIVRFADFETAKAFAADPKFQESQRLTADACTRDGTIVEGL